ncbi:MAG: tetratricopeptide repeat protein [Bacteroidales bacterium]
MNIVRKIFAISFFSITSFGVAFGQDLAVATDTYNAGAVALNNKEYPVALKSFNKALQILALLGPEEMGEEGKNLKDAIIPLIPQIHLRYGKELASNGSIDEALKQLSKAASSATNSNVEGVIEEVSELRKQLLFASGSKLLNSGKLNEAITTFDKLIEIDPTNSDAIFRKGLTLLKMDNEEGAISCLEKAIELGETQNAPRQLSTIFLKKSAALTRTKDWNGVFQNAIKANQYNESPMGFKLLGISSVQLKKYDEAIAAIESYLSLDPAAKDKNNMFYNLATSFEGKGDKAKACGYYKQLLNDPTFKQVAEYKVKTELKCN